MSQGIQDFYRIAAGRGLQRDFQLRITLWNMTNSPVLTDLDNVLLKTATLPQMETTINPAPFMGLEFNVPGTTKFPGSKAWNLEFYMTQQANLRDTFVTALTTNFNINNSSGNLRLPPETDTVQFALVDDNLRAITNYTLYGAFVAAVGDVSFDLTGSGVIQKIPVTIAYQYWGITPSSDFLGPIDAGGSAGSAGDTGSFGDSLVAGANAGFRATQRSLLT